MATVRKASKRATGVKRAVKPAKAVSIPKARASAKSKGSAAGRKAKGAQTKAAPATKTKSAKPAAAKAASKPQTPRSLVLRVYATIDGELTKLEEQSGTTSQDRERASRALSQMVISLERAIDMQRDMARTAGRGSKKQKEALAHAEDLRRQIAERLERLAQKRATGKRPE